jgi:hypothetical protein
MILLNKRHVTPIALLAAFFSLPLFAGTGLDFLKTKHVGSSISHMKNLHDANVNGKPNFSGNWNGKCSDQKSLDEEHSVSITQGANYIYFNDSTYLQIGSYSSHSESNGDSINDELVVINWLDNNKLLINSTYVQRSVINAKLNVEQRATTLELQDGELVVNSKDIHEDTPVICTFNQVPGN